MWFIQENVKSKLRFPRSKWRGQAERLVAWWNRPSPRGSIFPTMTMLCSENSVNPIMFIYQSTIFQGVWLWMSGAPWSFAPWGEGEWGRSICCHGYHVTKQYSKWSHLTKAKDVVLEKVQRKFSLSWIPGFMQVSRIRTGMRTAQRWTHKMRAMGWVHSFKDVRMKLLSTKRGSWGELTL